MRKLFLILSLLTVTAALAAAQQDSQPAPQQVPQPAAAQQYDLVLEGGRVIDPETGLDAVRIRTHSQPDDFTQTVRFTTDS